MAAFGAWNFQRLPIDAVPDITNVQVQINTQAHRGTRPSRQSSASPSLSRRQSRVCRPGSTRAPLSATACRRSPSCSRTVLISTSRRITGQRAAPAGQGPAPAGIEPDMGPIATGLGEIFMYRWTSSPGPAQAGWPALGRHEPSVRCRTGSSAPSAPPGPRASPRSTRLAATFSQFHVTPDRRGLSRSGLTLPRCGGRLENNNASRRRGLYRALWRAAT